MAAVSIKDMLTAFVSILIGVALTPSLADQIAAASAGNVTGVAATVLGLTVTFWAVMLIGVPISVVYKVFGKLGKD